VKNLDFSIVVCCYRGEATIEKCLDSLINQNYSKSNYEIIIVDDGSIDNSSKIIIDYINSLKNKKPLIKYYRTDNHGLSSARNFGIHYSIGNYILFIDEDAAAEKNWLNEYSRIISDKQPFILSGKVKPFPDSNKFERFINKIHYTYLTPEGEEKILLIGTNMGYKHDLFSNHVGFIDAFNYRGDESALLVLLNGKFNIISNDKAVVYHKQPHNILIWLKERMVNGKMSVWIDELNNHLNVRNGFSYFNFTYLRIYRKLLTWIWIPLAFINTVLNENHQFIMSIIVFISFLIFIKRTINRIEGKKRILKKYYRFKYLYLWPTTILLTMVGVLVEDMGSIKERLVYQEKNYNKISFTSKIILELKT